MTTRTADLLIQAYKNPPTKPLLSWHRFGTGLFAAHVGLDSIYVAGTRGEWSVTFQPKGADGDWQTIILKTTKALAMVRAESDLARRLADERAKS